MTNTLIASPEEQLPVLLRGTVDLNVRESFESEIRRSYKEQEPLKIKAGFDPTAPDIHLGHTVLMEKMRQFQQFGHDVIFIVGDYTALIGDPTGRNTLRPPLSSEEIEKNAKTYRDQAVKVLDAEKTNFVPNSSWLSKLSFGDIMKLASKYNLGRMLERRDFKNRFEEGKQIALHEFFYPLMQGYDSVVLENHVELGGHDQIFNLNIGRHLMEAYGIRPQNCMTVPLLVGLDGIEKMSKSKGNHIGITDAPDDMFGKVMSISDETMLLWYPQLLGQDAPSDDPLGAKKELARKIVTRFHNSAAANDTLEWWNAGRPARNMEIISVNVGPLRSLVVGAGFAKSNGEARRKISQGGVSLNGERISDPNREIEPGEYLLQVGKKSSIKILVQ
ncbi:MAG: tyrosine--tRNA ligase [Myxococcota bacterium]|nr:tyrosine--tRNA ligase [Myxococcota bacterium]